jgi:uncharacterized membrane protein YebE (DUF533 family)
MSIHYIRRDIPGELRDPFDCDEQVVKALVTVGAFVALADGHIDGIERDEAVNYIDRRGLGPDHLATAHCRILRCTRTRSGGQ